MTVLVTGGSGFVGLNLVEALLVRGEHVVVFDRTNPATELLQADGRDTLSVTIGDVRDRAALLDAMRRHRVTHVFHGAVITAGVDRERTAPGEILEVNLLGTLAVLEAAQDHGVVRLVFPSSLTVYGESLYDRPVVDEATTPPVPESLYGIAKYTAERMAIRFGRLWDLDVVCVRIGSLFGPWEVDTGLRDMLSPFWQATAAARAGRMVVLPPETPGRELTYSRDLADALVLLLFAEQRRFSVYNLASPANWDGALAEWCRVLARVKPGFTWSSTVPGHPPTLRWQDERPRARQCITRLKSDLGFRSRFTCATALADYGRWLTDTPDFG